METIQQQKSAGQDFNDDSKDSNESPLKGSGEFDVIASLLLLTTIVGRGPLQPS